MTASDFTEGGGYIADASGGVAVLLDGGVVCPWRAPHRRPACSTIVSRSARSERPATHVTVTGTGDGPAAPPIDDGIGGRVGRGAPRRGSQGTVNGGPTALSGGLAFDVDDGSGAVRVLVGTATGIDTAAWADGAGVTVVGVVGQRDSTGTGSSGYRVQPRAPDDVEVLPATTPTPSPSRLPAGAHGHAVTRRIPSVIAIAAARAAGKNARVTVRGVVTLASGTVGGRLGRHPGCDRSHPPSARRRGRIRPSLGQLVEVAGTRSTKSGMETLRVSAAPASPRQRARAGRARAVRSGDAGEAAEAQLVVVRGVAWSRPRGPHRAGPSASRSTTGAARCESCSAPASRRTPTSSPSGTWVEVRGVLGQDTTGAQPLRGYRVWPRDCRRCPDPGGRDRAPADADGPARHPRRLAAVARPRPCRLPAIGRAGNADLRVGATLVASAWPELGVAGLLWDGERLVGIAPASRPQVERAMEGRSVPLPLELVGLRELSRAHAEGIDLVTLGEARGDTAVAARPPAPPGDHDARARPIRPPGSRSSAREARRRRGTSSRSIARRRHSSSSAAATLGCRKGSPSLVGVGAADPQRIIVGVRRRRVRAPVARPRGWCPARDRALDQPCQRIGRSVRRRHRRASAAGRPCCSRRASWSSS